MSNDLRRQRLSEARLQTLMAAIGLTGLAVYTLFLGAQATSGHPGSGVIARFDDPAMLVAAGVLAFLAAIAWVGTWLLWRDDNWRGLRARRDTRRSQHPIKKTKESR